MWSVNFCQWKKLWFRHHNKLPHVKCKYLAVQIFTFIDIMHKYRHNKLPHVKCKYLAVQIFTFIDIVHRTDFIFHINIVHKFRHKTSYHMWSKNFCQWKKFTHYINIWQKFQRGFVSLRWLWPAVRVSHLPGELLHDGGEVRVTGPSLWDANPVGEVSNHLRSETWWYGDRVSLTFIWGNFGMKLLATQGECRNLFLWVSWYTLYPFSSCQASARLKNSSAISAVK